MRRLTHYRPRRAKRTRVSGAARRNDSREELRSRPSRARSGCARVTHVGGRTPALYLGRLVLLLHLWSATRSDAALSVPKSGPHCARSLARVSALTPVRSPRAPKCEEKSPMPDSRFAGPPSSPPSVGSHALRALL